MNGRTPVTIENVKKMGTRRDKGESYTFRSVSSFHLTFMQLSSFVPPNNKNFSHPLSILLQLWDHFVIIMYNIMWTGFFIRQALHTDVRIDEVCELIFVQSFCLRYVILGYKRKQICRTIGNCEQLWSYLRDGEDLIVREFENKGCYFLKFILTNVLSTTTLYVITARFAKLPPLEANGTERRMLPFRFFMDVHEEPAFTAVYILQLVVCYFICFMVASAETVSLYLIMMACGYLRSVRNRLLSYTGCTEDSMEMGEESFKNITECAHFHQQILLFCENIHDLTRGIFFVACICPLYNLSICFIKLLDNDQDQFKFISLSVSQLFQFFLCQWAPQYLIEESEYIAEAAYFASLQTQASSHREKINQILYFMMMRAQKPVQLTAGGYINLSIETFRSMLKGASSFFMMLRNFRP